MAMPFDLAAARRSAGFSQRDLAERSGVSLRQIKAIEAGKTERPRPYTMRQLAEALGVRLGEAATAHAQSPAEQAIGYLRTRLATALEGQRAARTSHERARRQIEVDACYAVLGCYTASGLADPLNSIRSQALAPLGSPPSRDAVDAVAEAARWLRTLIQEALARLLIRGWESAVDAVLDDGLLTADEETALMSFARRYGFTQDDLDKGGAYTRTVLAATIRNIIEGKVPNRVHFTYTLPFTLQRSESLIWVFTSVQYWEQRIRRTFEGGSAGMSIRLAKGVYYRIGSFKGHPIETSQLVHQDTGLLALTTEHLYFGGSAKNFRVPYEKIVSYKPYSDGIGIWRDVSNAKEQVFITGTGWFIYNLARNLAARL